MRPLNPAERDGALRRLRHARVWIAAGAVGLTGLACAAATATFRGHHAPRATAASRSSAPRPAPSGPDAIPLPPAAADDPGLEAPQDPPQAAPADAQPPATSGGS